GRAERGWCAGHDDGADPRLLLLHIVQGGDDVVDHLGAQGVAPFRRVEGQQRDAALPRFDPHQAHAFALLLLRSGPHLSTACAPLAASRDTRLAGARLMTPTATSLTVPAPPARSGCSCPHPREAGAGRTR